VRAGAVIAGARNDPQDSRHTLVNPDGVGDNDQTIVDERRTDTAYQGGEVFALAPEGGMDAGEDWVSRLSTDQVALLERLADGQTIAAAAAAEWMSLRTANRRVAELRGLLGLASTREVVAAYVKNRRR
jgi:hypothetical protein